MDQVGPLRCAIGVHKFRIFINPEHFFVIDDEILTLALPGNHSG
jgi:hypothetical protein